MIPRKVAPTSSSYVIYAAIGGNILVAITKIGAAVWTNSSAMWSEAVHSVVDSGNSILLLYGLHRAKRPPNREHPLGYGREIYFWSFVVAVLVFALGSGVTLYEGISHILNPEPIRNEGVIYIVIGLSAIFDGMTWWIALRNFKGKMNWSDILAAVRSSKDPPSFMVLFEDSAALIGLLMVLIGTYLSVRLDLPILDGVASIMIGLVLATTATLLAIETKGLLIGEAANPLIVAAILHIAKDMEGVAHANDIITVHLAPRHIVVALSLEFSDELRTPDIELKVIELERRLREFSPDVIAVFVKPQSLSYFEADSLHRYGKGDV